MQTDLQTMWSSVQMQLEAHRPGATPTHQPVAAQVPVVLLSGFLGAGKSTLLAHLLADPPDGLRIQALVNDVGRLPFDPTLIEAADAVQVQLSNGCGCCERSGEVADALAELAAGEPDLIVFEASGVADPFALAQLVEASVAVALDRIVTAVSAPVIDDQLASPTLGPIVERQLDAAHCVVLTHFDQLLDVDARRIVDEVAARAPGRVVVTSGLSEPSTTSLLPTGQRGARPRPELVDRLDAGLVTGVLEGHLDADPERLERALVASRPSLVRAKGRVLLDGRPHTVQLTSTSCTVKASRPGATGLTLVARSERELDRVRTALLRLRG